MVYKESLLAMRGIFPLGSASAAAAYEEGEQIGLLGGIEMTLLYPFDGDDTFRGN